MKDNNSFLESPPRCSPRVYSLREITISYEGENAQIVVKPPNLSIRGMFINTSHSFPEGAVLNLRFALQLTGAEVCTRCEVRYCQAGVGIGVEFIGLSADAVKIIEREIALSTREKVRSTARKPARKPAKKPALRIKRRRLR